MQKEKKQKEDGKNEDGKKEKSLQKVRGTSRQAEEDFLRQTLSVIQGNLANYGEQVSRMKAEIDEMLEHYHDNDAEVYTILSNTVTMHDHMKRAMERNERAQEKPYFGRIVFHDEALGREESLYIGKGGISRDSTHQVVVDWRAPVANVYYENGLGRCSYIAPGNRPVQIDLKMKRTYEIEHGKLLDYFDSEVVANDELLTKYLARNKQAVLGEIVATIQKEQNDIIRKSPYHNIIVQGVAGSGKTTVAMHRISFILYNYQERFRPEDFYIVGSNRILLNYITGVLPDLDVHGVKQMTMEELFVRLLYEDWDDKKYRIRPSSRNGSAGSIKGGREWFLDLKAFCDEMEWTGILRESVYLNPRQFVEGLENGINGVYDRSKEDTGPENLVLLVEQEAVERYIRQNPRVSMQSKINMLNDRLDGKIKDEFLGKGIKYTEAEKKAIRKAYRGRYGPKEWKGSIFKVYRDFLERQAAAGKAVEISEKEFDVYDLAALAYIYKRIKETEVISEAHHIVIDEAQDFGMMAYSVLHFCIQGCTYTVMGDVSQNIHFGFGLNDWEELKDLLLPDEMDSFCILKKSYRNTVEISNFATRILRHGHFSSYPVEPIIRHGEPVTVEQSGSWEEMIRQAAEVCAGWRRKGFDTIAVVCRSPESAGRAEKDLGQYVEVMESSLEKAVFGNGILVLPVEYTKGLEFDTVLILDPDREAYPVDDGHAKLLYVAATRALHELCVLHRGNLTGLIADPVPEAVPGQTGSTEAEREPKRGTKLHGTPSEASKKPSSQVPLQPETGALKSQIPLQPETGALKPQARSGTGTSKPKVSVRLASDAQKAPAQPSSGLHALYTAAPRPGLRNSPKVQRPAEGQENTSPGRCPLTEQNPQSNSLSFGTQRTAGQKNAPSGRELPPGRQGSHAGRLSGQPAFGDIPAREKLRPRGHARIDLAVRWITRQPDGLYLQSRYGILRLSPIGSAIIRVTFARNGQPVSAVHPGIAVDRTEKFWMYKDMGNAIELNTDELVLQVTKFTGAIRYMAAGETSRDRKLLLAEHSSQCRQLENTAGGKLQTWLYLDWAKEERLYSPGPVNGSHPDFHPGSGFPSGSAKKDSDPVSQYNSVGQTLISLRGSAHYISHGGRTAELPFLFSDKGYGLLLATDSPAFCCDLPGQGSYLHVESQNQMDYYFIAGKRRENLLNAYRYLCGRL